MSRSEKEAATKEYVEELEDMREADKFGKQNTNLAAFHDAQQTIAGWTVAVSPSSG